MIDGSILQSAQRCFEKKSRVVVKMVVIRDGMQTEIIILAAVNFKLKTTKNNFELTTKCFENPLII